MKLPTESPFAVLGIRPDAPDADVKAAWLARVQVCHPDRQGDAPAAALAVAEEKTKRLNAAYAEIKARRAAGDGPAPRAPERPGRPAPDEARSALEGLHRADRAVEDARAAVETYERVIGLARGAIRQIGSDLKGREVRSQEALALAAQAEKLAGALAVACQEAAARALAGEALSVVAAARKLPEAYVAERRTRLVRAELLAGAGLANLPAARSAARALIEDIALQVDRLYRRVRPIAAELSTAVSKAGEEVRRYRALHPTLPDQAEPAQGAVDKAVVAVARAGGLVEAEAPSVEPALASQWRLRISALEQAAANLALRRPTEGSSGTPVVPPTGSARTGTPGALPKPEAVTAAFTRLQSAESAAREALERATGARAQTVAAQSRGPDAVVADALRFIDAEIGALRASVTRG